MITAELLNYILAIIAVISVLFTVWNKIKSPQMDTEKKDALMAQQIQWMTEGTERRFKDMNDNFQALLLQSNNHIHTVDTKVDGLSKHISVMGNEIIRLGTIIQERIPIKGISTI